MSRLKRLINEIHRRCLWQVLSVYLISSWIVLQVADTVTDALGTPGAALVLLIALLPVVLATVFVWERVSGAPNAYATLLIPSASSDSEVGRRITE